MKLNSDLEEIRSQFPILERVLPNGKKLIYLDNAATSQKPECVINAMSDFYSRYNSNVHRAVHSLSGEATEAFELARENVAKWFGLPDEGKVIFTSGTTHALNLCAFGWARVNLKPGDAIVLTEMEHHSNIVPWQMIAEEKNLELRWVDVNQETFELDFEDYKSKIIGAKLACIIHTSNVLGTRNPVEIMVEMAHNAGAKIILDCAQAAAHERLDMDSINADFLAVTSHKMCGPTGVGALLISSDVFEEMEPVEGGGDMILEVFKEYSTYQENEHKFEAGTPRIAEAIGWSAAIKWMETLDIEEMHRHTLKLAKNASDGLKRIPGITVYGDHSKEDVSGVVSFLHETLHAEDIARLLDSMGIAVRTGHHCAQPLMRRLGVKATNRASFYFYNTLKESEAFVNAIKMIVEKFA
ncbi:MAG: cysteine desulfurase [Methanobacteriota archaeon]|nr:MAG: cysteine desulfurase [Euryarchaeota archaeon]|tara:strand:- start:323 stop:1558 length:1236 start_codon:yes stop_codon:yes gene_type:complete